MDFKKLGKKILTLAMAIAIVFTSVPSLGIVETAEAATGYTLTEDNLSQYNFKSGKYLQVYWVDYRAGMELERATLRDDGSCSEDKQPIKMYKAGGFLVYCVEHGVSHKSTTLYKHDYKKSPIYAAYQKHTGQDVPYPIDNIFKVLMLAPVDESVGIKELNDMGFADSKYKDPSVTYKKSDWYAAAQMLIWECQQMFRDENFERSENGLRFETGYHTGVYTSLIPKEHYSKNLWGTPAMDIYLFMASKIKARSNLDRSIAGSLSKPQNISLTEEEMAADTIVKEVSAGSYQGEYKVVDKKGSEVKGVKIEYVEGATKKDGKYIITITDKSILGKKLEIKHKDAIADRAEKYLNGPNGSKYKRYIWEHATTDGHTQAFVSGLDDPVSGWLVINGDVPPEIPGDCTPPDVEVFPTIEMPIEKIDANTGWDGDNHTPLGGAGLDATFTLERNIGGEGWQTIDTVTLDDYGSEYVFKDMPFLSKSDLDRFLVESGTVSGCYSHPIYGGDPPAIVGYEHAGMSKEPKKRDWDVTVQYKITETRPDGRYIDPDQYAGVREYSFTYHADSRDTCTQYCDSLPWTEVNYKFNWSVTRGEGNTFSSTGTKAAVKDRLEYDLETFVDDEFRGDVLIIKSNEQENPFKDSAMGGDKSNISIDSYWTIKLMDGFEGDGYVHLESAAPTVLEGGTHQYTVSRGPGIANNTLNGGLGMKVGTNGQILIKDLPYGRYEVTEVQADNPKYVLEKFTVVVSEHNGESGANVMYGSKGAVPDEGTYSEYGKAGTNPIGAKSNGTGDYYNNRYDVNLRDKIKENVVKIEKVDSETGKRIPLAGTKVYIRYKGNPDYTDEENKAMFGEGGTVARNIYNRFLPNAESIDSKSTNYTFELSENGEITIPYQLPYGKYEISEWLLPDGYFVGKYDETGVGKNHDFGYIEEGVFKFGDTGKFGDYYSGNGHKFEDVVAIYDAAGNKVKYQDKDKYTFEELTKMVVNRYTFTVTQQDMHEDGNFSQLVTFDSKRMDADPSYDSGDHPYRNYYRIAAVLNDAVKGKIEITKEGEALVGFKEEKKDGYTILTPVFETAAKLKDAVFGIFAAKDENLNDGSEGPSIYDSETGELVTIPKEKSSHLSNAIEKVKAFFGKLFNPKEYTAANYETGSYSHESGAELWYMLEREASEGNIKRTLYVSPEQKDTTYSYIYETADDKYSYRYDIEVILKNQAGGRNVTEVNVTKTTVPITGFVSEIPMTYMSGTVGNVVVDDSNGEIQSYTKPLRDPFDWTTVSELDVYKKTYVFEADGEKDIFTDGNEIDLSEPCPDRYLVKDYIYYKLTKDDLKTEERVVGQEQVIDVPGDDGNGDGDFDDPGDTPPTYKTVDVKETKTMIEWNNPGYILVSPKTAGGKAVLKADGADIYMTAVTGYYIAGDKTSLLTGGAGYAFVDSDNLGEPLPEYTVPDGWILKTFTGDPKEDPQYVIIYQTDAGTGETVYRVLLNDLINWQECTPIGNFEKMRVQVYNVTYTQQKNDPDGFTVNFDGFALGSASDQNTNVATTIITKQIENPAETIDVGAGYEYENAPQEVTFRTIPIAAPIYFAWADGTKADMYYKGGVCYTTVAMPASAVDYLYEDIVPTLNFIHYNAEGNKVPLKLDWYSKLSPENPVAEFTNRDGLADGVSVIARRVDTTAVGGKTMYYLEIVTNQTEDAPLEITFADGYTMAIYCAKAASGNNVGVLDLYNVYKTTRYTTSELVDVITTGADGIATSKLLPLGDYVVRELAADDNYLNESTEQLVELKYKDQFTPLIWGSASMDNKYFEVQLDLSKVFETAFKSGNYQPPKEGQTVKFGLYSAEDITATAVGKHKVTKKTIKADTLMDVITVDYHQGGSVLVDTKLPEGNYYLKELEAPEDYLLSDIRYSFVVREDDADYSAETTFSYKDYDGIYGKFVLEEKNHVETTVTVESRFPMPSITIDGSVYPLDADFESEDGNIIIDAAADFTTVKVDTYETAPTDITLPNGKTHKVKLGATGNTFDYTVDGVTKTFTPTVTYTGYYAGYEELWTPIAGEDLTTYTPEFTLTGAGTDKTAVILKAAITHEPSKTVTTKEQLIDPAHPELGFNTVTVESGNLTSSGNQIFKHSAVITVGDSGEITLNPKDKLKLKTLSGAAVTVSMDKYGVVKASIVNTLPILFTDAANSEVTTTGAFNKTQTFEFSKNVTLGRQDTSADKMLIKINSDNRDGFAVENDHKPEIEFVKVDKDDPAKKLSGAVFEIWSAKPSGEWTYEPDKLLGTYTTGADGTFTATLDYGTYFWREIKAPSGYRAMDNGYHKFRVIKGLPEYRFVVENEKLPTGGGGSSYQIEIKKVDKDTRETLAGAEFEIWSSKLAEDGVTLIPDKKLLEQNVITGQYGVVTISVDHKGTFFYREVKAPDGYKADSEFHLIDTTMLGLITRIEVENEKVTEPMIKTSAVGTDGSKEIAAAKKITIVDTVSYYNLTPGETYTMKGTIMDKATGKAITVNGKKVIAEKTFTPKSKDGSLTIKFTFDGSGFGGHKLVVFERLYLDVKLIAKHTDINDIDQTVEIIDPTPEKPQKPSEVPKTGDKNRLHELMLLLVIAFTGMIAAVSRKEKDE